MSNKSKDSNLTNSWFDKLSLAMLREPQNRKELIAILKEATKHSLLNRETFNMIENLLAFSHRYVSDIMIPRMQMVVIDQDATIKAALPTIVESKHSRFPVFADDRDKIVGILLAKDLLNIVFKPEQNGMKISALMRPPIFIPKRKPLNTLLREFRLNRNHMAIIVDEYGGVDGLVTIEDVLEEIVGDIADEYDSEEDPFIKALAPHEFLVKATTPIDNFNQYFELTLSSIEYDTIGGLLIHQLGRLPKSGEEFPFNQFKVKILKADKRRIYLIKLTKKAH